MDAVLLERFEEKYVPEPNSGCWLWTNAITGSMGYGVFWNGKRMVPAHRFAYEVHVGPIPDGLQIDHLCRVPTCVNPDHLQPVTQRVNILRGEGASAKNIRKTHCAHGHALTSENVFFERTPYGVSRKCRACTSVKNRAKYLRRKARREAS